MSRTANTTKNTSFGLIAQIITIIINFINRTIFIQFLGAEYLGLNGLFSNILSMLSLAELGLGAAISFSLYKPLSDKNERKTKALMSFYRQAYHIIGFVILGLGLSLIPFLDYLIKSKPDIPHFELIYMLFLLNTVVSYFFTYKRTILSADQKEYVNTVNRTTFAIILSILHFFILWIFKNYVLYLVATIICTIASNISISIKCDKRYPYLKNNKEKLTKDETKTLMKYVFAQMSHKIGGVIVYGTDNILTTSLVSDGLIVIGLYSNYLLLINTIKNVITIFFKSVTASVGNLNTENNMTKSKLVFNKMFFLNMCFYGITTSCIFNLANDFITIWLGKEYLLSSSTLILIIISYYLSGMRETCITYKTTLGLFWNDRYKPLIEAAINLVVSIILASKFGFVGILLGTIISTLTTNFWVEPYILYKHGFKLPLSDYYKRYACYTFVVILYTIASYYVTKSIQVDNFLVWIVKAILVATTSLAFTILFFFKTEEFKGLLILANSIKNKVFKKILIVKNKK